MLSGIQDYTIESAFRLSAANSTDYIFGNYGLSNSGGLEYYVYQNKLNNYISGNTQSSTTLEANKWYISCVTRNGSTITHYLNGIPDGSSSNSNSITTTNPYTIGNGHDYTSEAFGGVISSIKVYNRALTANEVQQNYNALRGRYENYVPLFLNTISSTITVSRNGSGDMDIFKTSGSTAWDAQAYSTEPFTAPCTIEFNKNAGSSDNGVSYAMIGWNANPADDASYTSLDHASYPFRTGGYEVYNNGSLALSQGSGVTWETDKKLYVVYDTDGYIRHYNGNKLLYSANYGTGNTVYLDSSIYSVNSTYGGFSNVKVIRKSWNGERYV